MNHWKAITIIEIMKIQQSGAQNLAILDCPMPNIGLYKWNFIEIDKVKNSCNNYWNMVFLDQVPHHVVHPL